MLNRHNLTIAELCPKDGGRFTLNGILVAPPKDGKKGYTCVTDGACLVIVEKPDFTAADYPEPQGKDGAPPAYKLRDQNERFILPADSALGAAKAIPSRSPIPILKTAVVADSGELGAPREVLTNDLETIKRFPAEMYGNFPDIDRVMVKKENCDYAIGFDAVVFARLLAQLAKIGSDGRKYKDGSKRPVPVTMYFKKPKMDSDGRTLGKAVLMESRTDDLQQVTSLLMPYKSAAADEFNRAKAPKAKND